jgi:hypothetical protein
MLGILAYSNADVRLPAMVDCVCLLLWCALLQVWEKSGYNTVEWVRYITRAGSYEIRC